MAMALEAQNMSQILPAAAAAATFQARILLLLLLLWERRASHQHLIHSHLLP
jgi:hypothetical protein